MNKVEFVKEVAKVTGATIKDTTPLVDAVFTALKDVMVKGESVKITGFGNFEVKDTPAREGHNPSTGKTMHIKASKKLTFKASSVLKKAVKGE